MPFFDAYKWYIFMLVTSWMSYWYLDGFLNCTKLILIESATCCPLSTFVIFSKYVDMLTLQRLIKICRVDIWSTLIYEVNISLYMHNVMALHHVICMFEYSSLSCWVMLMYKVIFRHDVYVNSTCFTFIFICSAMHCIPYHASFHAQSWIIDVSHCWSIMLTIASFYINLL